MRERPKTDFHFSSLKCQRRDKVYILILFDVILCRVRFRILRAVDIVVKCIWRLGANGSDKSTRIKSPASNQW